MNKWSVRAGVNEHVMPRTPGLIGALQYVGVVLVGGLVLGVIGAAALRVISGNGIGAAVPSTPAAARGVLR